MPLRRRRFLGAVLGLGFVACGGGGPAPVAGSLAPDFSLTSIEGGAVSLKDLRGKPVVVNFFATWCVPCKKELPAFQALAAQYGDRGLSFLLVDMQEDPDDVAVFLGDLKISLP